MAFRRQYFGKGYSGVEGRQVIDLLGRADRLDGVGHQAAGEAVVDVAGLPVQGVSGGQQVSRRVVDITSGLADWVDPKGSMSSHYS
jgi:hypothetical protein